jgi:hypothetical protein
VAGRVTLLHPRCKIITTTTTRRTTFNQELTYQAKPEYINGDTNWFVCLCGNTPDSEGFFACKQNGEITSPVVGGLWNGKTYVCGQCDRIIVENNLRVIGECSERVQKLNDNYDWNNY